MENIPDIDLVDLAQNGDRQAFSDLLQRHYHNIYKLAYRWCGKQDDAQDVAQEVCVKLVGAISGYRGQAAFSSWLYGITLNAARDFLRKKIRHDKREDTAWDLDQFQATSGNPENSLFASLISRCIALLPDNLRMAVILVHGEGLNHLQASQAQDCAEGTISWRLSEARKNLHVCLDRGDNP
ncbi:MAG: RNA polymerase sigma factor [Magnetococcales bacterium]|nr:RNA polymerase sigma factor [Magnetococcales bacterium]